MFFFNTSRGGGSSPMLPAATAAEDSSTAGQVANANDDVLQDAKTDTLKNQSTVLPDVRVAAVRQEPSKRRIKDTLVTADSGKIFVFCEPWATVYINGKELGKTPFPGRFPFPQAATLSGLSISTVSRLRTGSLLLLEKFSERDINYNCCSHDHFTTHNLSVYCKSGRRFTAGRFPGDR